MPDHDKDALDDDDCYDHNDDHDYNNYDIDDIDAYL